MGFLREAQKRAEKGAPLRTFSETPSKWEFHYVFAKTQAEFSHQPAFRKLKQHLNQ